MLIPGQDSPNSFKIMSTPFCYAHPSTKDHLSGEGLLGAASGVGGGGGTSHLDGNDTTKGASSVLVGNLDQADVALAGDGSSAGGAGGDAEGDVEVLVDVGGTLGDQAGALEDAADDGALASNGVGAVTLVTGNVGGVGQGGTGSELASGASVEHGLDGTAAIGGHDVEGGVDGVGDLGKSGAGLDHGLGDICNSVVAVVGGLTETVGGDLGALEDSGVDLGLGVGAGTRNDGALNTNGGTVATGVTDDCGDLSVSSDERRSSQEGDEDGVDVGEHFDCWVLWGKFLKEGWMSFVCLVLKASAEKRCDEVGRVGELKEAQPVREKRR